MTMDDAVHVTVDPKELMEDIPFPSLWMRQRGLDPNRPWLWWKDFDGSVHVVQPAGHFIHDPEPEPVGAPDAYPARLPASARPVRLDGQPYTAIGAWRARMPRCPTCGRRARLREQVVNFFLYRCAWGHEIPAEEVVANNPPRRGTVRRSIRWRRRP